MNFDFEKMMSFFSAKPTFDKKYSLFAKYILDEQVRNNMMANEDLYRKYNAYSTSIEAFLIELDKRFDIETIRKIIMDAVVKTPDEIMISMITSYLNSDEATKCNSDFVLFYNRASSFGVDSVKYLEENGIVANRGYKDIPKLAIESKFNELHNREIYFKEVEIGNIFENLDYPEKDYMNKLLEVNAFDNLDKLFERIDISLSILVKLLNKSHITHLIFRNDVVEEVGDYELFIYACTMMDIGGNVKIDNNIRYLILENRLSLVKELIISSKYETLGKLSHEQMSTMSDQEILDYLTDDDYALKMTGE